MRAGRQLKKHAKFLKLNFGSFFGETELPHWPLSEAEKATYEFKHDILARPSHDNESEDLSQIDSDDNSTDDEWSDHDPQGGYDDNDSDEVH